MDKTVLHEHAQRAGWPLPQYNTERAGGAPHCPSFRSTVTVNRQAFTSAEVWPSIKAAEHAAARAALKSLQFPPAIQAAVASPEGGLVKSRFQLLCQKAFKKIPVYSVEMKESEGFTATVTIENRSFRGTPAKRMKQAEVSAARAALTALGWDIPDQLQPSPVSNSLPISTRAPANLAGINGQVAVQGLSPSSTQLAAQGSHGPSYIPLSPTLNSPVCPPLIPPANTALHPGLNLSVHPSLSPTRISSGTPTPWHPAVSHSFNPALNPAQTAAVPIPLIPAVRPSLDSPMTAAVAPPSPPTSMPEADPLVVTRPSLPTPLPSPGSPGSRPTGPEDTGPLLASPPTKAEPSPLGTIEPSSASASAPPCEPTLGTRKTAENEALSAGSQQPQGVELTAGSGQDPPAAAAVGWQDGGTSEEASGARVDQQQDVSVGIAAERLQKAPPITAVDAENPVGPSSGATRVQDIAASDSALATHPPSIDPEDQKALKRVREGEGGEAGDVVKDGADDQLRATRQRIACPVEPASNQYSSVPTAQAAHSPT